MLIDYILIAFLVICSITDIFYRKAFNVVTYPVIFIAIILNSLYFGPSGLVNSLLGALLGMAFLLAFYMIGGMGAGDVKFMMAVGALKGWNFVLFGGLYGAVIAAALSILIMIYKNTLIKSLKKVFQFLLFLFVSKTAIPIDKESTIHLPYCFFLSLGMALRLYEIYYK
ncbi:MAG: hypothetical protein A2297_07110 [Elusimicrobia bacterium RIFOXYB2_FULL_48_7]|nr:MAG: hypothetical protein A2297_07110 [Elusimicrobia bacterium RIFOXYB2_FULL_48_7]